MASSDIYSAIAALTPTYDSDVTVNVRWPNAGSSSDALQNTLHESDAPMRMLGIPENTDENIISLEFTGLGNATERDYLILDRLWLLPTPMDQSLQYNAPKMLKYIDSYNIQVRDNRGLTTQSHIESVSYTYGWNNWPDAGGVTWFTVDVVLEVQELCTL
jgi:hypothetical protein